MSDYRSGVVLFPEGEVAPASARQLGIVSAYREDPNESDKGVFAVSYEPDFLRAVGHIAEFGLSEYWSFDRITEDNPLFELKSVKDEGIEEAREIFRNGINAAIVDFAIPDLSVQSVLDGRRLDCILPRDTETRMVYAYGSLFYMLNEGLSTSAFDATAHTWLVDSEDTFTAEVHKTSLRLGDYRKNIDIAREGTRTVLTTSATKSNQAKEIYLGVEHGYGTLEQDIEGQDLQREHIATPDLHTILHEIPGLVDQEGIIDPIKDKNWRAKLQ